MHHEQSKNHAESHTSNTFKSSGGEYDHLWGTAEQLPEREAPSFDAIAHELLNDESLESLSEAEQGRVIADRFVGAVVRRGVIEGSQTSYTPEDILKSMDDISSLGKTGMSQITRQHGLRAGVLALAKDPRVAREFSLLSDRLAHNEAGEPVLTSPAQLEGYLLAGGAANRLESPVMGVDAQGDEWMFTMLEQVQRMASDTHLEWLTKDKARDLISSSSPLIQNTGRDWLMALSTADKVGADTELIRRSAEKIQQLRRAGRDMGGAALFMATGGQINDYRAGLYRRSR